ncbi:FAD-dependent oxidoreductase [Paenibacillus silviterrae]|uniref:FAD-dependent oxidoreductase n=1 Tax=Paenibacillus silviterrae TaxID=3242194 RepID=UPI002543E536|nr:FAD-dependent oxidoreductase [Paenibacillus chinjuensis]
MKQAKRYSVLVVGATFAGLGAACALRDQTLVLEKTGAVGSEFTSSYREGKVELDRIVSPHASELRIEALQRNMISEAGGIHWPAFVPVLHQLISKHNLEVLFLTRIVEITAFASGGFEVVLMNGAGLSKVQAGRIIDTTSLCDSAPVRAAGKVRSQRLNAVVVGPEGGEETPPQVEGFSFHQGRFPSEWVVSFPIGPKDDWSAARAGILSHWAARPAALQSWRLATIGDAFDVTLAIADEELEPDWHWHPSCRYADPIAAFEAGIQYSLEVPSK